MPAAARIPLAWAMIGVNCSVLTCALACLMTRVTSGTARPRNKMEMRIMQYVLNSMLVSKANLRTCGPQWRKAFMTAGP